MAKDYEKLKTELAKAKYAAMSDQEAAADLNTAVTATDVESISTDAILEVIDPADLQAGDHTLLLAMLSRESIALSMQGIRSIIGAAFSGTDTLGRIQGLQQENRSWARINFGSRVTQGDVAYARRP
jgi:hypothetical protein